MSKRDRKALGRYVRRIADLMELRDWTIELPHEPLPSRDNAHATVWLTDGRKVATIRFASYFREQSRAEQRNTVVHELVHCHLAMAQHQVEKDLERHLGQHADRLFFDSFRRNLEYGVDGLAEAFARYLPLIDWPS